jgi:hypothetical protein
MANSQWLSATGYRLSAIRYPPSAIGYLQFAIFEEVAL